MTNQEIVKKLGLRVTIRDGQEMLAVTYSKPNSKEIDYIKTNKPEIIAYVKGEEARRETERIAREQEEKAKKEAELEALKNGSIKIEVHFHDGEYLSGYEVYGQAGELLEKTGAAKYIDGWGYSVDDNMVDILGKEFTYLQVEEYTRPAREAKAAEEAKKEAEKKAIFDKARETGEKQVLRSYTTGCNDPREECSTDIVTVYAMPDGTTKTVRTHTW